MAVLKFSMKPEEKDVGWDKVKVSLRSGSEMWLILYTHSAVCVCQWEGPTAAPVMHHLRRDRQRSEQKKRRKYRDEHKDMTERVF